MIQGDGGVCIGMDDNSKMIQQPPSPLYPPNLMMPIEGNSFTLLGDFDEETAEQIVETIEQQTEEGQE